jgi:DNA mismatch repair protein MutS
MKITPIRQQYLDIKHRYPDTIVFFRLGDFYETFDDDAKLVSDELQITLTSREMGKGNRIPLAGIPYHAVDNYLAKLINRGFKVAICEQLSQPGKGLVERDVIRVITPGTIIEPSLLKDNSNNFLVSLVIGDGYSGIAYIDITTGEFATTQLETGHIGNEISRLQPSELLISEGTDINFLGISATVSPIENIWFNFDDAYQALIHHFGVINLEGFGCEHLPAAVRAAGAILHYLSETQKTVLNHIEKLSTYYISSFMTLDPQTRRNLEIFTNLKIGSQKYSLLSAIDLTKTASGCRLLKMWLGQPLLDITSIMRRQNYVDCFFKNHLIRKKIIGQLSAISDMERLINRVKSEVANSRDLIALSSSLKKVVEIKVIIALIPELGELVRGLRECPGTVKVIDDSIADQIDRKDNLIKTGFSSELDELIKFSKDAKQYLANLEQEERKRTGIRSLKISYNRVFGYFIEISNSNLNMVPENYVRKQTLTNGERFYTAELKEYETAILNSQERISELESTIFKQICQQIALESEQILITSKSVAELDVFTALADTAEKYSYVKPEINDSNSILIKNGRHPVVEQNLGTDRFIPNDTVLDSSDTQIIVLTGPNMSGKSTYLRQVALIVLLAQIGSFVPAESARIGIVDRIFTRIGAQEDLATGQSTFMVEMMETANILNNATNRSLLILDEVGRGTSTYDGLSIAWAIVEYLHNKPKLQSKTLFATHYHELVELAQSLPRVKNYNLIVSEDGGKVIFLRKIMPGGADKSYGIHVAQLAGIPQSVIRRAEEILVSLEDGNKTKSDKNTSGGSEQLALFNNNNQALVEDINKLNIDSMTPLEAITALYSLKRKATEID